MAFRPSILYALLRIVLWLVTAAAFARGQTQSGIATYFHEDTAGPHQLLSCQHDAAVKSNLPSIAISSAHLTQTQDSCSRCILLAGTGTGIGGMPVSTTPIKYLITHSCVDCTPHELEIGLPTDADIEFAGKWTVSWSFTACHDEEEQATPPLQPSAFMRTSLTQQPSAPELSHQLPIRISEVPESGDESRVQQSSDLASLESSAEDVARPLLSSEEVASHRRLSWASVESDLGSLSESLPSAEWLEAAAAGSSSGSQDGSGNHNRASRRQLIAQDSGRSRRLSLRGLLSARSLKADSELPRQVHESEELPSAAWQAAAEAAAGLP